MLEIFRKLQLSGLFVRFQTHAELFELLHSASYGNEALPRSIFWAKLMIDFDGLFLALLIRLIFALVNEPL